MGVVGYKGQKSKRGFAAMSPERRKEIAAMGGRTSRGGGRRRKEIPTNPVGDQVNPSV